MGSLINLYAFFRHPYIFGFVGAMSSSLLYAKCQIFDFILHAPLVNGRIYMDVGTREHSLKGFRLANIARSRRYNASVRRIHRLLVKKGCRPKQDILYIEEKWARLEEDTWARRLPGAVHFFLAPLSEPR